MTGRSPAGEAAVRRESAARSRRRLLVGSGIAAVVMYVVLVIVDDRLKATGGQSILSLEFAGSRGQVDKLISEWGDHGVYLARLSLWLDFALMASYGTFLTLTGLVTRDFARDHGLTALARVGVAAPFFGAGAALFDAAENVLWLFALGGHGGSAAPPVATACASLKFLLLVLAIVYAVWGLVARWRLRRARA